MSDTDTNHEHDGRCVKIDTGYYEVQVWGDPDDNFADVAEQAEQAADRAKADVKELKKNGSANGDDYA